MPSFPKLEDSRTRSLLTLRYRARRIAGMDLGGYKDEFLLRRAEVRASKLGLPIEVYAASFKDEEVPFLLGSLSIGVSEFFRDPKVFEAAKEHVIAPLMESRQFLRIWCPGCASGEEAYSWAMLCKLEEQEANSKSKAQCRPQEKPAANEVSKANSISREKPSNPISFGQANHQFHVLGSDIDASLLSLAKKGVYAQSQLKNVPNDLKDLFFSKDDEKFAVSSHVKSHVHFSTQDLLSKNTSSYVDIISCRNLLIYLSRDAQARIIQGFHSSLNPKGFLVLGMTESLPKQLARLFCPVDASLRIYQKIR